jgi:hypothetical protein
MIRRNRRNRLCTRIPRFTIAIVSRSQSRAIARAICVPIKISRGEETELWRRLKLRDLISAIRENSFYELESEDATRARRRNL